MAPNCDIPGVCAWCSSEDIEYEEQGPIFDEKFVKFKFKCNKCDYKSIEIFHLEFCKTELDID